MNCIVKLSDNKLTSFYYNDKKIYYKTYENGEFCDETELIRNVLENFTVCIAHDSTIYLFCQNTNGDVLLCTKTDDEIKTKVILQNQTDDIYKVQFTAIITEKGLNLIYNTPTHLVMQQLDTSGKWKNPINIDSYIGMEKSAYIVQNISYDHLILFYLTSENYLAYREINSEEYGNVNIFHSTTYQISDTSFLVTKESLHMIFVVKNMFSHQLLYRRKDSLGFSNIKVLWEAPKIDNILAFVIHTTIYVSYAINGQLYMMSSADNGNTFSRITKYKERFAINLDKSRFISESLDSDVILYETYVLKGEPCKILLIPELYSDFYKRKEVTRKKIEKKAAPPKTPKVEIDNEAFNRLQNQYNLLLSQNEEKDRQILHYVNLLKARNTEIITVENNWKTRYNDLLEENARLKQEAEIPKMAYEQISIIE